MKKITFIIVLVLALYGCAGKSDNVAVISGKWLRGEANKICLFKMENGETMEIASSALDADSAFYFACKPDKGSFYFIGLNKFSLNRYTVYLKAGDRLDLTVTEDSYKLNGNSSAENKELEKWHDFVLPIELKSVYFLKNRSNFEDFFPLLTEKQTAYANYPKAATGNKNFDREFEVYKRLNFTDIIINFLMTPREKHPQAKDLPDCYHNLKFSDFVQNNSLMDYPSGIDMIDRIIFVSSLGEGTPTNPMTYVLENLDKIANDTLKGEMVLKYSTAQRTYAGLADYAETYGKYLITDRQKNKIKDSMNSLATVKEGLPAIDFKFPDINGKEISLSSLKGKVVYIDVWATWCGPCKQEIPHLKKLEGEYHNNKDIVFMSISTDAAKDIQKWKNHIAKDNMTGLQLFAGDKAQRDLLTPYKIVGIPRFILVGKDGNIITPDAPRPSSREIRVVLNSALSEQTKNKNS